MDLLIIDVNPFGVLTDVVKWTQYLSKNWSVRVLCFSPRRHQDGQTIVRGVSVKEVHNYKNRRLKAIIFILHCIKELFFYNGKVIVEYFPFCEILKRLFPKKIMMLDIRTMSVNPDEKIRNDANRRIRHACQYFDKVTAISEGVANQLGKSDVTILPLGSDIISSSPIDYLSGIRLLYIGILTNRRIEDTIEGVASFHTSNPLISIEYTIIGYGTEREESHLRKLIISLGAEQYISFVGRKSHEQLPDYIAKSNVGLSYVPITDYFDYQPPTKTFEYCLSGLYCIATGTAANKEYITSVNGTIIHDTPQGVVDGLETFQRRCSDISEMSIRDSLVSFTWERIVSNTLEPILASL